MTRRPHHERIFGQRRTDGRGRERVYIGRDHPLADSHGECSLPRILLWLLHPDTGDSHDGNRGWLPCSEQRAEARHGNAWEPVSKGGMLVNWRLSPPSPDALYTSMRGDRPVALCRRHSKGRTGPCGAG